MSLARHLCKEADPEGAGAGGSIDRGSSIFLEGWSGQLSSGSAPLLFKELCDTGQPVLTICDFPSAVPTRTSKSGCNLEKVTPWLYNISH